MRRLFFVLIAILPASASTAQNVHMSGLGALKSCGDFIAASENIGVGKIREISNNQNLMQSSNTAYMEWARGFIGGINWNSGRQFTKDTGAGLDLWLRNWCNSHPTEQFCVAVAESLRSDGVIKP